MNNKGTNSWNTKSQERSLIRIKAAYSEWLATKASRKALAKKYKTCCTKLTKYIREAGHVLETFNVDIFNVIDTEEKAYWLGFLYADGYVSDGVRNGVELSLQLGDKGHLEKFKTFLNSSLTVKSDTFRCRLTITNPKFKADLIKHGCTPKKTFTLTFPKIPKSLEKHFIRGFFDGDGCITRSVKDGIWNSASISCAADAFMTTLIEKLSFYLGVESLPKYKYSNSKLWVCIVKGNLFSKLVNFLYEDCSIYLDRKYERYSNSIAVLLRD